MAKQLTEDELNLRRKTRRRLIGAVILTLAVVVILPMVLDSEPKPAGQDIDLRIPDPDKADEFVPVIPASKPAGEKPSAAPAANTPPPASEVLAAAKPVTTKPVVTTSPSGGAPAKAQPDAGKTPETLPANKAATVEGYVAQVGAYSNAATAKQELDKLKKWGFKAYTEMTGDKVRVRVGPYADRAKAEQARQQLEKRGLKPVVMSAK